MQEEVSGLKDFLETVVDTSVLSILDFLCIASFCRNISMGNSILLEDGSTTYEINVNSWITRFTALYSMEDKEKQFSDWESFFLRKNLLLEPKEGLQPSEYIRFYREIPTISLPLLQPFSDWKFQFQVSQCWYLLKLLFYRDLMHTYQSLLVMKKDCGIDGREFTPGEFLIFLKQYQAMLPQKEEPVGTIGAVEN